MNDSCIAVSVAGTTPSSCASGLALPATIWAEPVGPLLDGGDASRFNKYDEPARVEPEKVRRKITRRQIGFRVQFPSMLMDRMIACESLLEGECARMLEISPGLVGYSSVTKTEHFKDSNKAPFRYTPDFHVERRVHRPLTIEVKYVADLLKPKVMERVAEIAANMRQLGRPFMVVTDEILKAEPWCSNRRLLIEHLGQRAHRKELDRMAELISREAVTTVEGAAALFSSTAAVYRLIARRYLCTDLSEVLGPQSAISLCEEALS